MSSSPDIGTVEWNEALGHTIKVRRTDIGLTRQQLADASTISYSYLSAIENGAKAPSTKILRVIADRLGLEAKELLALVDDRLERGSEAEQPVPDEVLDIIELQEQRFRRRQEARIDHRAASWIGTPRQKLATLISALDDEDVKLLTRVAQRLLQLERDAATD